MIERRLPHQVRRIGVRAPQIAARIALRATPPPVGCVAGTAVEVKWLLLNEPIDWATVPVGGFANPADYHSVTALYSFDGLNSPNNSRRTVVYTGTCPILLGTIGLRTVDAAGQTVVGVFNSASPLPAKIPVTGLTFGADLAVVLSLNGQSQPAVIGTGGVFPAGLAIDFNNAFAGITKRVITRGTTIDLQFYETNDQSNNNPDARFTSAVELTLRGVIV